MHYIYYIRARWNIGTKIFFHVYYYAEMALPEEPTNALFQRDSPLTTSDAYDLLVGEDDSVNRLPFRPTGGAVFKYFNREGPQDWRADGHRWINQGTTSLPRRDPLVKKNYFYIQTESGGASKSFIRSVFFLPNDKDNGPFLIQYLGDSTASKLLAHRNTKTEKATMFVRTKPSKVKVWKQKVETEDAHVLYKKEVARQIENEEDPVEEEILGKPRISQIITKILRKPSRIGYKPSRISQIITKILRKPSRIGYKPSRISQIITKILRKQSRIGYKPSRIYQIITKILRETVTDRL